MCSNPTPNQVPNQAPKPIHLRNHWQDFPEFYNHPFIQSIAGHEAWTISDKDKRPIDMWDLVLYNQDLHKKPKGASNHTNQCLMTLGDVCKYVPAAKNNAYYFDSNRTGCIILDIEKTCSEELKAEFLKTNYIYGEVSMSGKGLHLVYKTPACLRNYPEAMKKLKMQDNARGFEFLMEHWITFTRVLIPPANPDATPIDDYFEQLCAQQKYVEKKYEFDVNAERPKDIPQLSVIMMVMKNDLQYKKTVADFYGDVSRYEFGFAAMLYRRLERILTQFKNHEYSQTEKAWIIYDILVENIPYRDKHETLRDGKPWLLYLVQEVMAKNANDPPYDSEPVYPPE